MSWIDKFKDLYSFKSVIGLEIPLDLSDRILMSRIERKDSLISVKESRSFENLEELSEYLVLHKNIPVTVLLTGRNILVKSIHPQDADVAELSEGGIQVVMPSYTKSEFYCTQFRGQGKIWFSVVRRKLVDNLLERLHILGIMPVQVYIGPFALSVVLEQLNVYSNTYIFNCHFIELNEQKEWVDYSFSKDHINCFNIKIGDYLIKHEYITSYAVAFSTLMNDFVSDLSLQMENTSTLLIEEREKIKFRVNGTLILTVTFILLLINSILFNSYYNENIVLKNSLSSQDISDQQYNEVLRNMTVNENKLRALGWNGGVSKAFLLERLGLLLNSHPNVYLTKFAINPKDERKSPVSTHEVIDNSNTLILTGNVLNLNELNSCVNSINEQDWVKTVRIIKFGKDESISDAPLVFSIEVIFDYEV